MRMTASEYPDSFIGTLIVLECLIAEDGGTARGRCNYVSKMNLQNPLKDSRDRLDLVLDVFMEQFQFITLLPEFHTQQVANG